MKLIIGSQVQELVGKTSGKPFKKFSVKDEMGVVTEGVVAFPTFSQFNMIVAGGTVEALLKEGAEFQGRKSFSLADGNLGPRPNSFGGIKTMEIKAKQIEKAQDNKAEGIMISSTARMATDTVIALLVQIPERTGPEEFKKMWIEWRKWFMDNWDGSPKDNEIPF